MIHTTLKFRLFKSRIPISDKNVTDYLSPLFSNKPSDTWLQHSEAPLKKGEPLIGVCLTGGSESSFLKAAMDNPHSPVVVLTHNRHSSYAAGLELSARLNHENKLGRRAPVAFCSIHDEKRLRSLLNSAALASKYIRKMPRLGVIGEPSDWLVASGSGSEKVRKLPKSMHIFGKRISQKELITSFAETKSLKESLSLIVKKYSLDAFTIRCFDLLPLRITSCLEVSEFNDLGITAACEGDIPSAVTMMIMQSLAHSPVFMANTTGLKDDKITFAHCTIPKSLCSETTIKTHFETGLGKAICGKVKEGTWTVGRIGAHGELLTDVVKITNPDEVSDEHCRTQILVKASDAFTEKIRRGEVPGNHMLFVPGDYKEDLEFFTKLFKVWKD